MIRCNVPSCVHSDLLCTTSDISQFSITSEPAIPEASPATQYSTLPFETAAQLHTIFSACVVTAAAQQFRRSLQPAFTNYVIHSGPFVRQSCASATRATHNKHGNQTEVIEEHCHNQYHCKVDRIQTRPLLPDALTQLCEQAREISQLIFI